jgi:hypothetical protein
MAKKHKMLCGAGEQDDGWLASGTAPILVVQGADDRIAPPENGHRLKARWPASVDVIDIPRSGYAVLNEQPDAIAEAIPDLLLREQLSTFPFGQARTHSERNLRSLTEEPPRTEPDRRIGGAYRRPPSDSGPLWNRHSSAQWRRSNSHISARRITATGRGPTRCTSALTEHPITPSRRRPSDTFGGRVSSYLMDRPSRSDRNGSIHGHRSTMF